MRNITLGTLAIAALLAATPASAQPAPPVGPDASKIEVKVTDLGQRTYMLEGLGGNVTVALADDGVIMVDGQFATMNEKLKGAIAKLSNQPIRYLVNTHYHGDHTGGNDLFGKDGVVTVSHVNVRNKLAGGWSNALTGAKSPALAEGFFPKQTYTDAMKLELKGRVAQLKHTQFAHTDGDTFVHFADANVISTGDVVALGRFPTIDFSNGGNIKGMITAVDGYLALSNDTTKIVPGHGPLIGKKELTEYRDFLVTARDRMAKLVAEGKSEEEAIAAKPYADLDVKYGANEQASRNWVRMVYASMKM